MTFPPRCDCRCRCQSRPHHFSGKIDWRWATQQSIEFLARRIVLFSSSHQSQSKVAYGQVTGRRCRHLARGPEELFGLRTAGSLTSRRDSKSSQRRTSKAGHHLADFLAHASEISATVGFDYGVDDIDESEALEKPDPPLRRSPISMLIPRMPSIGSSRLLSCRSLQSPKLCLFTCAGRLPAWHGCAQS